VIIEENIYLRLQQSKVIYEKDEKSIFKEIEGLDRR